MVKREGSAEANEPRSRGKRQKRPAPRVPAYDATAEPYPSLPIYHKSFASAKELIPQICKLVLDKVKDLTTSGLQDPGVKRLTHQLRELEEVSYPAPRRIGILGDTAAGKSSLINCLLGEEVSVATDNGSSGTHVIQEFVSAPPSQQEMYSVVLYFHHPNKVAELVERYSGDIYEYMTLQPQTLSTEEEQEIRDRRTTAIEFFTTLLCDQHDFQTKNDTIAYFESAKTEPRDQITTHLSGLMSVYLKSLGCDKLHQMSLASADLEYVLKQLRTVCTPVPSLTDSAAAQSPWPLIDRAQVRLKESRLLSSGIMLVDLPGVTDSNRIRVEATRLYLQRCSTIIVAHPVERILTHSQFMDNVRESERTVGLVNTIIVATKIDTMKIDENDVENWPEDDQLELESLEQAIIDLVDEIEDLEEQREDGQGYSGIRADIERKQMAKAHAEQKPAQKHIEMKCRHVRSKVASNIEEERKSDDDELKAVVCVSNSSYKAHAAGYNPVRPPTLDVEATGIPALRQILFAIPAGEKFTQLQKLGLSKLRIALNSFELLCGRTGFEGRHEVKAEILASKVLCLQKLEDSRDVLNARFKVELAAVLKRKEHMWAKTAQEMYAKWNQSNPMTYNAICRRSGEWFKKASGAKQEINWSQELVDIFEKGFKYGFTCIKKATEAEERALVSTLVRKIRELASAPKLKHLLVGLDLDPFYESLHIRGVKVATDVADKFHSLRQAVDKEFVSLTSPWKEGYVRRYMEPAFQQCMGFNGAGCTEKRRNVVCKQIDQNVFAGMSRLAENALDQALQQWIDGQRSELDADYEDILHDVDSRLSDAAEDSANNACFLAELNHVVVQAKGMVQGQLRKLIQECERAAGDTSQEVETVAEESRSESASSSTMGEEVQRAAETID